MTLTTAEIRKLRRRRGLMSWSLLLTLGSILVPYAVLVALHGTNPAEYAPAGGVENFEQALGVLATLGGLAAILIATTAGSQDHAAGVFRELAVTGRSRVALFLARVRGAAAVYFPLLAAAFGLALAASYVFAGGRPTADARDVLGYAAWVGAAALLNVVLGVSLASVVSGRVAVGVLLVWNVALAPMLIQVDALGGVRAAIGTAAAQHFAPASEDAAQVGMSSATALTVLGLWLAIPLFAGARVTQRRDA